MKKSYQKLFRATLATTVATGALVAAVPTFTNAQTPVLKDLDKNQDYYQDVLNLVDRGIIKGFPDGTYGPYKPVTRGQAAKILANILGLDTKNVKDPGFKDVKKTDEYYGAIAALAEKGIISGYPDKTYGQANTLTRSQMAKIIAIGFDLQVDPLTDKRFTDVKATDEFAGYVQALLNNQITKGTTATTFSPAATVTRSQIASFVVRAEKAVKQVATIQSITENEIVLSTGTFQLTDDMKKVFNASNAAVLKDAKVSYKATANKIDNIHTLELVADGTAAQHLILDGQNTTFAGNIVINGDFVELKNITVNGNLEVGKDVTTRFEGFNVKVNGETIISNKAQVITGASVQAAANGPIVLFTDSILAIVTVSKTGVTIEFQGTTNIQSLKLETNATLNAATNITIPTLELAADVEITIDSNIQIGVIIVPIDTKIEDIITNFDQVKDNIEQIKDTDNNIITPETPPIGGGGGGGGGVTPAPDYTAGNTALNSAIEQKINPDNFDNTVNDKVSVTLVDNEIKVLIKDQTSKLEDFKKVADPIFTAFQDDGTTVSSISLVIDDGTPFSAPAVNNSLDFDTAIGIALKVIGKEETFLLTELKDNSIQLTVQGKINGLDFNQTYTFKFVTQP